MQPNNDYLKLLRIDDSRPNQNISDVLKNISLPIALVVDQLSTSLKIARHICSTLSEQRGSVIVVILNDSIGKPPTDSVVEIDKVIELTDAWLKLDVDNDESKEISFNKLSSLIELIFYDYQELAIGGIDYSDVLTILASGNKLFNDEINPISHSQYSSIEGYSIFEAINHSVSRLQNKPAKNSNVLARVTLNTDERDYDELETALKNMRNQYTGDCFIAPIHDSNMSNTEVHVTVFITKHKKNKNESYKIPDFLKKS